MEVPKLSSAVLLAALAALPAIAEEPLIGRASVIDGDTIEVHDVRALQRAGKHSIGLKLARCSLFSWTSSG